METIPKIIHYCWFGENSLSNDAVECIETWRQVCPDYQIKEWNEQNFNINCCPYVQEAYREKKWAFVSDFARFWILYNYGGIYFDTDVKILKSITPIVEKGPFMAWEENGDEMEGPYVAPGLGLAYEKGNDICGQILRKYESIHFVNANGTINTYDNVVRITSDILKNNGLVFNKNFQTIHCVNIYPANYFCPMNKFTGEIKITEDTYTIHLYAATWLSDKEKKILEFEKKHRNSILIKNGVYKLFKNIYCYGLCGTLKKLNEKISKNEEI